MKTTKLFLASAVCAAMMLAGCSNGNGTGEPEIYNVVVTQGDNGTISADKETAAQGETVTLIATPHNGYLFKEWAVEGVAISPDATARQAAFTMPARNIIVTAEFTVDDTSEFSITVTARGNGTAEADKETAKIGETVTLNAEAHDGELLKKWIAQSGDITFSPDESGTTVTFTMPAGNVSIVADFTKGVLINGIRWSTSNVGAPGTFANPGELGMLYQWNSRTGWSTTDPMVSSPAGETWKSNTSTGEKWEADNDPCPEGWRVPTILETFALTFSESIILFHDWIELNGVYGQRFTDYSNENNIFLPAAGKRADGGQLTEVGIRGYYWSSTPNEYDQNYAKFLDFDMTYMNNGGNTFGTLGFSVRCVDE